jgi:endonuclease YncB( thermonuclease family)
VRSRRSRSWAVLIAGLLVVGLAAWLLRREHPAPDDTSTPSPDAGRETGWAARWTIDGDTLDIERDGQVVRLRLLNIDAPERRTADHGPQCLAEAATTRLIELAPRGTELTILTAGQDRYGRTLGEAWLPDGRMLGAEIVRSGLAAPVTIGGQDTFRAEMDVAQAEAAANARGLHDPKENCSLPAHVVSLEGRAHGIPPEDAAGRGALSTDAATVLADLTSARPRAGVAALTAAERDDLVTRTRAVLTAIQK